jgi:TPR repeat protein
MNIATFASTFVFVSILAGCAGSPTSKPVGTGAVTGTAAGIQSTLADAARLKSAEKHQAAARKYQSLARDGNEVAMLELGKMYVQGEGVRTDDRLAEKWLSKPAENGNADAQFELAKLYSLRDSAIQDFRRATQWHERAARQGHVEAQFNAGIGYEKGYGVKRNMPTAISWFLKAAQNNHKSAQFKLGIIYLDGIGVPKNPAKAFQWMLKSAKNGNVVGQLNTGLFYLIGHGVAQNRQEGKAWLERAAQKGNKQAKRHLAKLERERIARRKRVDAQMARSAEKRVLALREKQKQKQKEKARKAKQAKLPRGSYDSRAAGRKLKITDPEIKCLVAAHKKLNAYWIKNKYSGKLTYSDPDDREKFEFYLIVARQGYTIAGRRPQDKYNGLLDVLFNKTKKSKRLRARFEKDCT